MRQFVPGPHRHVWLSAAMLLLIGATGVGCASSQAAKGFEMPALDAPPAPPRVVTPVVVDATPIVQEVVPEEETPTTRTPPRPLPARTEPPKPAPVRVEREPEREPSKPEEIRPSRTLQTPASAAESEVAIREQLARAEGELQRVDYRTLSLTLKDQYDVAKRFIQQSREALTAQNLVYAATLAGKASEIAEVLPRR
jgi:hypothetical protein